MQELKNPITALRDELSLSRTQFCRRFNLSYETVWRGEHGMNIHLPGPVFDVFHSLGRNPEQAAAQYSAWRASYASQE